ncbi:MAG: WD40 repeat domain-containing protein [Pyrinomonadaceae bacterium]
MRHLSSVLFTITLALWLSISACHAQTLSGCRPAPPMPPNVKPGVVGLSLSRDGKTLVVAGGDAKIRFVDMATGEVQRTFNGHTNAVYRGVFSPDEKLLASSSRDRTARIWEVASGRELQQLDGFRCSIKAVGFSPDGQMLAASGNDGMLKLWDVKTGKELKSLVHKDSADIDMATYAFVFSRDGKKIYAGNGDGTISEWDTAAGKETKVWRAHDQSTFRLQFSPDYRILASFGDSVVKLWDTSNWQELRSMSMARSPAVSAVSSMMVFSHNGELIAASNAGIDSKQQTYAYVQTLVWKVRTGEKLYTLEGHKFDVDGLIFTSDDRFLLTGGVDTTIKFWDMKTGQTTRTINLMPANKANE